MGKLAKNWYKGNREVAEMCELERAIREPSRAARDAEYSRALKKSHFFNPSILHGNLHE